MYTIWVTYHSDVLILKWWEARVFKDGTILSTPSSYSGSIPIILYGWTKSGVTSKAMRLADKDYKSQSKRVKLERKKTRDSKETEVLEYDPRW